MIGPEKYPSTPHWPWSLTVHRDDSYHSDPEYLISQELVITEKVDGGNTCLFDGEAYARSIECPAHHGWFAMVRKHHAWKTLGRKECFYGEDIYGIHSIEYDPVYEHETFYLFNVRYNEVIVSWDQVKEFASELNVPHVGEVYRGRFSSVHELTRFLHSELKKPSFLGGSREGFVVRNTNQFNIQSFTLNVAKFVRANHVQTDAHWTRNWRPCKLKR